MYLKPEEADNTDPPIIVNRIKKRDKSKLDEYRLIPDVDKHDVIIKNTLGNPSFGMKKKYRTVVSKITIKAK